MIELIRNVRVYVPCTECDHSGRCRRIYDGARGGRPAGAVRHGAKVGGLQMDKAEIRRADAEHHLFGADHVAITEPPDGRSADRRLFMECDREEALHLIDAAEGGPLLAAEGLHGDDRVSSVTAQHLLRTKEVDVGVLAAQDGWEGGWDGSRGAIKLWHLPSVAAPLAVIRARCVTPRVARRDLLHLRAAGDSFVHRRDLAAPSRQSRSTLPFR